MSAATSSGKSLQAVCVDRTSGRILHDIEVLRSEEPSRHHTQNGFASPTPVLDGKHVFVHFGPRGTVCLDTDGKMLWKKTELLIGNLIQVGLSPVPGEGNGHKIDLSQIDWTIELGKNVAMVRLDVRLLGALSFPCRVRNKMEASSLPHFLVR